MKQEDNHRERIALTQDMRDELTKLQEKTGWGARSLYNYAQSNNIDDVFKRTSYGLVEGWIRHEIKTVNRHQFETIIRTYKNIPKELWKTGIWQGGRVSASSELIEEITYILNNSGNISLLIRNGDFPKTLTPQALKSLSTGKKKTLTQDEINAIHQIYAYIKRK